MVGCQGPTRHDHVKVREVEVGVVGSSIRAEHALHFLLAQ